MSRFSILCAQDGELAAKILMEGVDGGHGCLSINPSLLVGVLVRDVLCLNVFNYAVDVSKSNPLPCSPWRVV